MSIEGMKDEDLNLLTDEERAGLEDDADDTDGEDGDDGDADEGEEGADADEGDGDEGEDADGAAAPPPPPAEGAKPAGDDAGRDDGQDDEDEAPRPAAPTGDRVDPKEVQTKLDDIQTQKAALADQLDDGEITTKEYTEALDKLNDDKNSLSNQLARQQEHDESVQQGWYKEVEKFLGKNPDIKTNQTRLQSFDGVVRRVTGDPENATLSNRKQLEKAHALWKEEMGFPAAPAPKVEDKTGKTGKAPKPKPQLPPTLHNVPAADIEIGDDGKFSHLDGLLNAGKMIEHEDALAKLSEADQQDYLSRA